MKPAIQSMERYGALFCQLMDECQQQREEGTELHFPLLCVEQDICIRTGCRTSDTHPQQAEEPGSGCLSEKDQTLTAGSAASEGNV